MTEIVSTNMLVLDNTSLQVVRLADFVALLSAIGETEVDKCEIWTF
ncbi:hypothetical protein ABTW24_09005 [Sphingobacterium thalpophilum]|uniref:Uncharacterized protein n=1 Tax=Sphingobacterium thalpophilum TaxID=259 RepID=A0ABV4HB62_9SPHI